MKEIIANNGDLFVVREDEADETCLMIDVHLCKDKPSEFDALVSKYAARLVGDPEPNEEGDPGEADRYLIVPRDVAAELGRALIEMTPHTPAGA